ncbi:MAG: TonB-dependent receptor [Rudaea sp.]
MLHKFCLFFSTFLLGAGLASAGLAQTPSATPQPTIEVTASRIADTVDSSLADVSVITRTQIDASGAPDLIDLLRLQAGVDVTRSGGAGTQTSVFMRGTNANHVLVLIDGVRVASSNTGAFAWENLPLDAIQRVEIVRGPRASYWGSDAIGGVIQIFTRKLDGAHIAASYGSYRSADGSVGFGAQSELAGFSLLVGARHVGGFSASNPAAGEYVYNPDDNGLQNHNFVASGDYKLGTQMLSATVFRSAGTQSFDNGDPGIGISHTLDQSIGTVLQGQLGANWQQKFSLGTAREDLDTPAFQSAYYSTRKQASWSNDFALSTMQHLIAGVDYVHDRGRSIDDSGFGAPYAQVRNNSGVFAGWKARDGALDSELSGRYDDNSAFGNAFSGSAAVGWNLNDGLRLSANYGTAFRAPTLNELYSPGYGGYYAGNPDLDAEHSRTAELGLDWNSGSTNRFGVHAFATRIRDLIDFTGGSTFQAINVEHAVINGAELTDSWHSETWSMDNTLTLQNPRNRDTDSPLLRRPKQKFTSLIERTLGDRSRVGLELVASGQRKDLADYTLPGYALINLRASFVASPSWNVTFRLENLFDRTYELTHGYNTPGRSGYVEVTWQPVADR